MTRRSWGTRRPADSQDGGPGDHCPNQLEQDQLFTCTERAFGSEKLRFWEFRQPSIPESGAADGRAVGHPTVVPVDVISQPEPHPTTLEGHAALRQLRSLPPNFSGTFVPPSKGLRQTTHLQQPAALTTRILYQFGDANSLLRKA